MAEISNAQRAPILVETSTGQAVFPVLRTYTIPEDAPFHIQNVGGGEGTDFVVGDLPGTATILVSSAGQVGSLEVTVTAAPLVVSLGVPEPK